MEINKLAAKLGLSRREVARAARAGRKDNFTALLAHRPMRKAMPREPRPGATHEENQRYEDAMNVHVAWREKFDAYAGQWKAQRTDAYRSPDRAARKAMARARWEGHRDARRSERGFIAKRAKAAFRALAERAGISR